MIGEFIKGAVAILSNRDEFKRNAKEPTTAASIPTALGAIFGPEMANLEPGSLEAGLTQIALGLVTVALFFYRKHGN